MAPTYLEQVSLTAATDEPAIDGFAIDEPAIDEPVIVGLAIDEPAIATDGIEIDELEIEIDGLEIEIDDGNWFVIVVAVAIAIATAAETAIAFVTATVANGTSAFHSEQPSSTWRYRVPIGSPAVAVADVRQSLPLFLSCHSSCCC